RFQGREIHEYLLTLAVPESISLHEYLAQTHTETGDPDQTAWRRTLCIQLGRQIRRLHQLGFDHRDLKASNFLVRGTGRNNPAPCIVDLEGVRRWPLLPYARRCQNLVRLNLSADAHLVFSRTDRLRFLKEYLGDLASIHWKNSWRRLTRLTINRRRQFERLHKPLR
ncbi:MAG: lipopolysaccharide kinase InaA family protein, partial [Planctomycetales bacterium]